MRRRFKNIWFLTLIIIQAVPLLVILFFALRLSGNTENAGWIFNAENSCKCFTQRNAENRSFTWSGACADGLAEGKGILIMLEHGFEYFRFEGELRRGKANGHGRLVMPDGDTYEGDYRDGLANGQGRFYYDEGDYYEGDFQDGQRWGEGTYWYESKSEFLKHTGTWKQGKANGPGTLYYRDGRKISGTFQDGELIDQL